MDRRTSGGPPRRFQRRVAASGKRRRGHSSLPNPWINAPANGAVERSGETLHLSLPAYPFGDRAMRTRPTIVLLLSLGALLPVMADGQRRPRPRPTPGGRGGVALGTLGAPTTSLGVRGGYDATVDRWSVGAQLRLPVARRLAFVPSGDVFLGDSATDWQLNADLTIPLRGLYVGGGIGLLRADDRDTGERGTRAAPNLLAGFEPRTPGGAVRPFIEGRWTFPNDGVRFRLVAGVSVPIGDGGRRRR